MSLRLIARPWTCTPTWAGWGRFMKVRKTPWEENRWRSVTWFKCMTNIRPQVGLPLRPGAATRLWELPCESADGAAGGVPSAHTALPLQHRLPAPSPGGPARSSLPDITGEPKSAGVWRHRHERTWSTLNSGNPEKSILDGISPFFFCEHS